MHSLRHTTVSHPGVLSGLPLRGGCEKLAHQRKPVVGVSG
jgi:hypothetical protein